MEQQELLNLFEVDLAFCIKRIKEQRVYIAKLNYQRWHSLKPLKDDRHFELIRSAKEILKYWEEKIKIYEDIRD